MNYGLGGLSWSELDVTYVVLLLYIENTIYDMCSLRKAEIFIDLHVTVYSVEVS